MKRIVLIVFTGILIISCSIAPKEIVYGKDMCVFCNMTIVAKTHAAELVTKKGKVFKYDAVECMINDLSEKDESTMALLLVTDFTAPTSLIDATKAHFLISEELKSPMGENLTAFKNKKSISFVGVQYNWEEIKKVIQKE